MAADEGLGAYRQYEEIGAGSHSRVYKARKRLGIEFVALRKVDKSRQPKLLNEVRALGELRHGNVLAFHGWYYTERHLWVVTEYCAGGDLAALLAHDGQLPEPTVVSLGLDALAALQHVHGRGFLAVDLTPRAFLLNESGLLKLSDLGASRHISEASAPPPHRLVAAMGGDLAPSYLAPEILAPTSAHSYRSDSARTASANSTAAPVAPALRPCFSHASDFWSLGALLHHMAAGEPPFASSGSLSARLLAAATRPTPELAGASRAFAELQRALLQKEPTLRPSWEEMREHAFWSGCLGPAVPPIPSQPMYEDWVESKRRRREELREAAARRKALESEAASATDSDATSARDVCPDAAPVALTSATDARSARDRGARASSAAAASSNSPAAPAAAARAVAQGMSTPKLASSAHRHAGAPAKGGRSGAGSGTPRTHAAPRVASRLPAEASPAQPRGAWPAASPAPVGTAAAPSRIPRPAGLRQELRGGREAGAEAGRIAAGAAGGGGGARGGGEGGRGSMGGVGGQGSDPADEMGKGVTAPSFCFAPIEGANPSGEHSASTPSGHPPAGASSRPDAPSTPMPSGNPPAGASSRPDAPSTPMLVDACGRQAESVGSSEDAETGRWSQHRENAGMTPSASGSPGPLVVRPILAGKEFEEDSSSAEARKVDCAESSTHRADAEAVAAAKEVAAAKLAAAGALAALRRAAPGELQLAQQSAVTDAADARAAAASAVPAAMSELMQIIFHPSEWTVKPIALDPSIEAPSPTERFEPRALPFKAHAAEALLAMRPDQIEASLIPVVRSLGGGVAGIPSHSTTSAEKSNVVLYCESLASEPRAATLLLNSPLATLFARLLHTSPSAALRLRIASVLAALLRHATLLDRGIVLETLLPALLAAQTDRAVPVRRRVMAALGEIVYYGAVQQEHAAASAQHTQGADGAAGMANAWLGAAAGSEAEVAAQVLAVTTGVAGPAWQIPPPALDALTAGLRDADAPTHHYAVRTVENVLMRASNALGGHVAAALCTDGVLDALLEAMGRRSAAGGGGSSGGGACGGGSGGGNAGCGGGPTSSALRGSAAAAAAQLLRLRPDLAPRVAADEHHLGRVLAQMREAGNAKPAQAAVTCLLLVLSDADARRALAASTSEPQRRQMISCALALARRPQPLLRSKGCLAAALLCSLGTSWLRHAVEQGLLGAIEAVCGAHSDGNSVCGNSVCAAPGARLPAGTSDASCSSGADGMPSTEPARQGAHRSFSALVGSAVRRILASLQPALLRLVATPHFAARLAPTSPVARHTCSSPAAAALAPATPSPAKLSRTASSSCAAPALASQAALAPLPSWETPDTEAALSLLLALAQCAPIASAMAPSPTLSALAACLHALCHMSESPDPARWDGAGGTRDATDLRGVGAEGPGVVAASHGMEDGASSCRGRVATSVHLALHVATHLISAADPPALAALAAHAPRHLSPNGLLGALCRSVGASNDTSTRLEAIHAAAALAHATVAGSPRAASAAVAPTLLSHLLPQLVPILEDALRGGGPLLRRASSDQQEPDEERPASDGAAVRVTHACSTPGECAPRTAPAHTRTPAKASTALGGGGPPDAAPELEAARSLLLLLSAIPSPPADVAHALDRLSLVPVLCRTLFLLSSAPRSSNSTRPNAPCVRAAPVLNALQTPHAFAPLLRALAERPAVALRLGLAPMLASIILPSVPHRPAQLAPHDALHPVLDAAYLLLCFGVSVCRQHGTALAPRPSPSRPATPPPAVASSSAAAAAALATAVAEQLRPLAGCATTLLALLDPTADARLAEKAAHCELQICELLALVDPHAAAAAVLGGGLGCSSSGTVGATALTAALATGGRSELSRCIGRFMAVLRTADEPSFIAAMAAMPGLAAAMTAAAAALYE